MNNGNFNFFENLGARMGTEVEPENVEFAEQEAPKVQCLECGVVGHDMDECEGCGGSDLELALGE